MNRARRVLHHVAEKGVRVGATIFCPACDHVHFLDGRWTWNGDEARPSFTPSIHLRQEAVPDAPIPVKLYVCHSYVENGTIRYLNDCTHNLAGQTVPLPPF